MNNIRFDGQTIVVTGGGRGLGAAYARLLAARGGTVVVHDAGVDRAGCGGDEGPANDVAAEIKAAGGKALVETANLATQAACEALIDNVLAQTGRIDALIHSAGIVRYDGIAETPADEWIRMREINIDAPFWLCRAVWPHMRAQRYGRIVLTASGYGLIPWPDSDVTAYGVGKAAQFGLMNGLAGEGERFGIKANVVAPVANTRIYRADVPAGTMTPASVAPGVVLLAARECPWNGMVLRAAGGKFGLAQLSAQPEVEFGSASTPEAILAGLTQ